MKEAIFIGSIPRVLVHYINRKSEYSIPNFLFVKLTLFALGKYPIPIKNNFPNASASLYTCAGIP